MGQVRDFILFFLAGFISGFVSFLTIKEPIIFCILFGILIGCIFWFNFTVGKKRTTPIFYKRILKGFILFFIGAALYGSIEVGFRGYTHQSMLLCGGICFVLIGLINELVNISIVTQMVLSALIVTLIEFITGCIVNLWLHLDVWDYSYQPYNLLGQICLLFSNLWFLLSFVAIIVDDYVRHRLFNERFPKYYL